MHSFLCSDTQKLHHVFCVKCGREEKLYESLCRSCFLEKDQFVSISKVLNLARCADCGRALLRSDWTQSPEQKVLETLLYSEVVSAPAVNSLQLSFEWQKKTDSIISVSGKWKFQIYDLYAEMPFSTTVRLKHTLCQSCSRVRGSYYEAIIQIRAHRKLTPDELREFREFVTEFKTRNALLISKETETDGGLDFYVSPQTLAQRCIQSLIAHFGGKLKCSRKLYGMKDGKPVYRTTFSLRLPEYRVGDIVLANNKLCRITRLVGRYAMAKGLENGENIRISDRTTVKIVKHTLIDAIVVSETERELQVLDENNKIRELIKPKGFVRDGDTAKVILLDDGSAYLIQ